MSALVQVNVLSFDIVKQGQDVIGKTSIRVLGTSYINPTYVTSITPDIVDSTPVYYVRLCKLSIPGQHNFYTDQSGLDLLTLLVNHASMT